MWPHTETNTDKAAIFNVKTFYLKPQKTQRKKRTFLKGTQHTASALTSQILLCPSLPFTLLWKEEDWKQEESDGIFWSFIVWGKFTS